MSKPICPYCTNDAQDMIEELTAKSEVAMLKEFRGREAKFIPAIMRCDSCSKTFVFYSEEAEGV